MLGRLVRPFPKMTQETTTMGSINYSDHFREGDMADEVGVSLRRWPYLCTRMARKVDVPPGGTTAIFAWDGHSVRVEGSQLYYDEKLLDNVVPGPKQFAVVNTKLVIWPDKAFIDLTDGTFQHLGAVVTMDDVTFEAESLTAGQSYTIGKNRQTFSTNGIPPSITYTYGKDPGRIKFVGGKWTLPSPQKRELYDKGRSGWESIYPKAEPGDIVILRKSGNGYSIVSSTQKGNPNTDLYNKDGVYGVIKSVQWASMGVNGSVSETNVEYEIYHVASEAPTLSDIFKIGDVVTIKNAGDNSRESIKITGTSKSPNKLTFEGANFKPRTNVDGVTIERAIPDMDFICSRDNRLWGVSNSKKTVYASVLGDPTNFNDLGVLADNAWASVIGSDGDFTAIASYRQYLLCFKGEEIIKVMGTEPSNFAMTSITAEGVKAGCHKSLQVLNGTLYYMGSYGIYAYTGATPYLISPGYGDKVFRDAVGGSDGDSYFVSCIDQDGEKHLYSFETRERLWVREDAVKALDFARKGRDLYILLDNGAVELMGAADTDRWMPWSVTTKPIYVTAKGRKTFYRLLLRVEVPQGSWMEVYTREDGKTWEMAHRITGETVTTVPVQLRPGRCDKFEVMLKGQGKCTVLEAVREYRVGSVV